MYCGPKCIAHVHRKHGGRLTTRQAAKMAGTNKNGTTFGMMSSVLAELNYEEPKLHRKVTWKQLREWAKAGKDIFVPWWSILDNGRGIPSKPDGHWCVVEGIEPDELTLYDPDRRFPLVLSKEFFIAHWWDWQYEDGKVDYLLRAALVTQPKQ